MNEQNNSSRTPLLVLRVGYEVSEEDLQALGEGLERIAQSVGASAVIEGPGLEFRMEPNPQTLLSSIEKLVQSQTKLTQSNLQLAEAIQAMLLEEGLDENAIPTTLDGR